MYITGTPLARALESEDKVLRAAAAALLPAYVILTPRSQAKVAADAMEALKKLAGGPPWVGARVNAITAVCTLGSVAAEHIGLGPQQFRPLCARPVQARHCHIATRNSAHAGSSSEQVKEQAARAILALVQGQALLASQGLQAKPYILLSACREAECCRSEEDVPSPWDLEVTRQPLGSLPRPHMSGLQLLPDLAGLEALAEQLIFQSHGQEHAEVGITPFICPGRAIPSWCMLTSQALRSVLLMHKALNAHNSACSTGSSSEGSHGVVAAR